jgi:hypothetical protein
MSDDIEFIDGHVMYVPHSCNIDSYYGGSYDPTCKACTIEQREERRLQRELQAEDDANENAPH